MDDDRGMDGYDSVDMTNVNDPPVIAQLDAENAFNRASRTLALLQCRYKWPSASRFLLNGYRGDLTLLVRGKNKTEVILSQEGVAQGDPAAGMMFAAGTLPMIQELKELTRSNREEVALVAEGLERNVRDDDLNPDHTLYIGGGVLNSLEGDDNSAVGIGVYITNHKGDAIFSAGQVTRPSCSQTEADLHALVFGLRVVDLLGIEHLMIRCTSEELISMMKGPILPPEGAMRGLRYIAVGIATNLKQLVFQSVQRDFVGIRPCIGLLEDALQRGTCIAYLHSQLGVKKEWIVPPLHERDHSGMAAEARLNIRKYGFPVLVDEAPMDLIQPDEIDARLGVDEKRPRLLNSEGDPTST